VTVRDQLALPFPHEPDYGATEFLGAPSNAAARAWLARTEHWPGGRLALWGEAGCGKTHLLHRWAVETGARLIAGPALRGLPDLPLTGGVAIDDAEGAEECALLHLLNAAAEAALPVLLAGRTAPARWPVRLPDLASRLRSVNAAGIGPAEDDLLRALLARLLSGRQLAVPPPLQEWLLLRLPRTPAAIREAAARLDRAALAAGAGVTRSLAVQVLAGLAVEAPVQKGKNPSAGESAASPCVPSLV
jgi:chromosomal replication initiation ATPase DnaA